MQYKLLITESFGIWLPVSYIFVCTRVYLEINSISWYISCKIASQNLCVYVYMYIGTYTTLTVPFAVFSIFSLIPPTETGVLTQKFVVLNGIPVI
jgi:hypothetical protein